jgi:preprotein translocase subunit SecG
MTAVALIILVLMHSGRDTGMAGMGYVPASQGGTHIVERNLTRLTVAVGTVFFANSIILYHILS